MPQKSCFQEYRRSCNQLEIGLCLGNTLKRCPPTPGQQLRTHHQTHQVPHQPCNQLDPPLFEGALDHRHLTANEVSPFGHCTVSCRWLKLCCCRKPACLFEEKKLEWWTEWLTPSRCQLNLQSSSSWNWSCLWSCKCSCRR